MIKSIKKYDKSNLLNTTNSIPVEVKKLFKNLSSYDLPIDLKDIKNIFIAGMGGSGISADIISSYLNKKSSLPIFVNKNTVLPNFCNDKTLCIFISYSGNTKEIISLCSQAIKKNAKIFLITKGGEIESFVNNKNIFIVKIVSEIEMPRSASLLLFYSVLTILSKLTFFDISNKEIENSLFALDNIQKDFDISINNDNDLIQLASNLLNKKIVILGVSPYTESIALRWKNQFNENSKELVYCSNFPELTHNEIVALYDYNLDDYYFLILRDKDEDFFISKQIDNTLSLLNISNISYISESGDSSLERIVKMIYRGDYLSIYLALLKGIDPTPITSINLLKEKMKDQ